MKLNDYKVVDPGAAGTSQAGQQLGKLANDNPFRAARLVDCLERFVATDTDVADRIIVEGQIEIYVVPPRFVLVHVPDAAALIRVNHARKQVDVVQIIEEYDGTQWDVEMIARHWCIEGE
jgi:hypothetical protein